MATEPLAVVIAGPTGSGKSELAMRIAGHFSGAVVNYDSVQLYRGFDIGSAKPSREAMSAVPHHLFDVLDASQECNAADYVRLVTPVLERLAATAVLPVLAGGTFFYLRALLGGLPELPGQDPAVRTRLRNVLNRAGGPQRLHRWLSKIDAQSGRKIAPADRQRLERALEVYMVTGRPLSSWSAPTRDVPDRMAALKVALHVDRKQLVARLERRVDAMYAAGLVEETRELLARFPQQARPFAAIGYREAVSILRNESNEADAIAETKRRTRAYAKRQMTWLRSERNMHWLEATDVETTFSAARRLIEDRCR